MEGGERGGGEESAPPSTGRTGGGGGRSREPGKLVLDDCEAMKAEEWPLVLLLLLPLAPPLLPLLQKVGLQLFFVFMFGCRQFCGFPRVGVVVRLCF